MISLRECCLRAGLIQAELAEWTHTFTALEGNTITAGDTLFVLTEGLTMVAEFHARQKRRDDG